jgi:two-component system, cell cycle sensor histidine kinase and response regulator CckA
VVPSAPEGRLPRGTETVLLVEDERPVRAVTLRILRAQGYCVLEAGDGAEALALAQRHPGPIHLLLADVVMPRMGGIELAERLRALRPETRVLHVSGYVDRAIWDGPVPAAGAAFLQKPFLPETLVRKVREVLGGDPRP